MQNLAAMFTDNCSYLRLLFYIKNVNFCFHSAMVQNSILHNKALPHIIYKISCCILFCLTLLCDHTMLYSMKKYSGYIYIYIYTQNYVYIYIYKKYYRITIYCCIVLHYCLKLFF